MYYVFLILLFVTALFLIVLVLVQRGKGGGLAGALGGMGGQSAFGTKAGDTFTKITIGVAAFWIVLCMFAMKYFNYSAGRLMAAPAPASGPQEPGKTPEAPAQPSGGGQTPAPGSTGK
jgi:preprotein translocase subunit SecG